MIDGAGFTAVELRKRLIAWTEALSAKPVRFVRCMFSSPAQEREVQAVEATLGQPLPETLRYLFLHLGGKLEFNWSLPDDPAVPECFRVWGELTWDLYQLPAFFEEVHELRPGTVMEDAWKDMVPFSCMNGDFLAVQAEEDSPVYCLRPGDPPDCAIQIGETLIAYLQNCLAIGCVADADQRGFVDPQTRLVSSECERAKEWREWMNVR